MNDKLKILEIKFNYFLNQTIIGASKDYYKIQRKYCDYELQIMDDIEYEEYLKKYIKQEDYEFNSVLSMPSEFEDDKLNDAVMKSLTDIERLTIKSQ